MIVRPSFRISSPSSVQEISVIAELLETASYNDTYGV